MWANAQRDGHPTYYRWRRLFNAAVWLTPTIRVPCSNAASTRNPLKFAGVPQTRQRFSAVSRPKFAILPYYGHICHIMTLATCQPSYLYNLLQVYHPSRALRSSTQQLLHVPYMSTDFGRRAFSYSSPATWNSIPLSIKNCSSLYSFKRHLKSYFIAQLTNN